MSTKRTLSSEQLVALMAAIIYASAPQDAEHTKAVQASVETAEELAALAHVRQVKKGRTK